MSPLDTPMVRVLAGIVVQAPNPDEDAGEWLGSAPNFRADVGAFEIDERAASRADWARCVDSGACTPAGTASDHPGCAAAAADDAPAGCIDLAQAYAFCTWAKKRLPSELEVLRAEMTLWERRPKRARDAKEWTSTPARWKQWPNESAFVVAHSAPRWSRRGQRAHARQPALGVRCVRSREAPSAAPDLPPETRTPLPEDAIAKYTAIWLDQVRRASAWTPARLAKHVTVTSAAWAGSDGVDLEITARVSSGWFVIENLKSTLPVNLDCASRRSAAPCDAPLEATDYETLESEGASLGRRFKLAPLLSEQAATAAIGRRFGALLSTGARGLDETGHPWLCILVSDPTVPGNSTAGGVNLVTGKTDGCAGIEMPGTVPWAP
jgi:hypothetical protein